MNFIDLFAGIGGFHLALSELGHNCVFASEIDKYCQITYKENFGIQPYGDITKIDVNTIPDHDILCAGFPCQPFSMAGKRLGFSDTRGTLFFDIERILEAKHPEYFILENVAGLKSHNKGQTLKTILDILRHKLGYYVPEPQILISSDFGVPQKRRRIYIIGFKNKDTYVYPEATNKDTCVNDILEENVDLKYYISDKYMNSLLAHKERHSKKNNGFGFQILDRNGYSNTLVKSDFGKVTNLIIDEISIGDNTHLVNGKKINEFKARYMTPREFARLQGYPDSFKIPVSNNQAYRQFGNSVSVPVIKAIADNI